MTSITGTNPRFKRCKDCVTEGITDKPGTRSLRPASYPGPRCATHWRLARKARSARSHELRIEKTYGITSAEYWAIYASQGGRCYVCQKASGKAKRLAVDHQHDKPGCDHPPDVGCPNCIRCLACGPCNERLLGRYDVGALARAITVLTNPPAQAVLFSLEEPDPSDPPSGGQFVAPGASQPRDGPS